MDRYLEIAIRPDPELPAHVLMGALYAKLHRALVDLATDAIGVSFPDLDEAAPSLGRRLRLHGTGEALGLLLAQPWQTGLRDHMRISSVASVPADALHRVVQRVQAKSSPQRLRRRLMRRHGVDEQEACRRIPDEATQRLRLPFVQLHSSSTGQTFRVFVAQGPAQAEAVAGRFSSYGLGLGGATVPWFR